MRASLAATPAVSSLMRVAWAASRRCSAAAAAAGRSQALVQALLVCGGEGGKVAVQHGVDEGATSRVLHTCPPAAFVNQPRRDTVSLALISDTHD